MKIYTRIFQNENDFWRIRNFLREVFLLNSRLEHSWHVARFDYWRWHLITNCRICDSMKKVTTLWETGEGQIAGVLHPSGWGEIRMHVHPQFRSTELEHEMLAYAENHLIIREQDENLHFHMPVFSDDTIRQQVVSERQYKKGQGMAFHRRRDLDSPLPEVIVPAGYVIRSMGSIEEHPKRSWASWRAFHADEGDTNYDGDWSWYQNIQSAPLYRRDLDIVAVNQEREIASFCTIYYDDYTRSAVCVLVGTAAEHQRIGLGKAVILEGMRRLQKLGCTRVFATAYDPPANAFYGSVLPTSQVSEAWFDNRK
jgi:mycothiol synthase